jgi:hypothetical protein
MAGNMLNTAHHHFAIFNRQDEALSSDIGAARCS